MGFWATCGKSVLGVSFVAAMISGCQVGPTVSTKQLARHTALVEKDGLDQTQALVALKILASPPEDWPALKTYTGPLYTHQQWRSPSKATGVGVVYLKLPLPMNPLVWFAKQEYTKKENNGRLIAEWTDSLGRRWFEAENNKYHAKGYAIVSGTDAWIVYSGYRVMMERNPEEVALAERCQESILIQPNGARGVPNTAQADARD